MSEELCFKRSISGPSNGNFSDWVAATEPTEEFAEEKIRLLASDKTLSKRRCPVSDCVVECLVVFDSTDEPVDAGFVPIIRERAVSLQCPGNLAQTTVPKTQG